jgi:hypothetical protein
MSPFPHSLLQVLLSVFGAVVGGLCGFALKAFGGEKILGPYAGLLELLGGAAGFLGVYFLWDRWVPIHCPSCRGRMTKAHARWGRYFIYTCDSCGRTQ